MKRTVILAILDGWGVGSNDESNPIHMAKMETFDWLFAHYPVTSLQASGISVGLPWGETSNSEVGHLTLGAGKVIYQYYPRLILAIQDKSFFKNEALLGAFAHAKKNNSAVNVVGLLTKANVHASLEELVALIQMAQERGVDYKLHLWADGKDSPPKSFLDFIARIPKDKIATLAGRYYGMDHNKNWRLTERAYQLLVGESGDTVTGYEEALKNTYDQKLSEEFLPLLRFTGKTPIEDNESIIFYNFREDGIRQIAEAFIDQDFNKFPVKKFQNLHIVTMTRYEERFGVPVAFPPEDVTNPLGKVLADKGLTQFRIAETYKYAHITYFFNGYHEEPYVNEYRVLIPSLSIPHLNEKPELMASAITDRIIDSALSHSFDFVLANYANGDLIAHTGDYDAGIKAAEVIDKEIGRLLKAVLSSPETFLLITSDHGNLERMYDPLTGRYETQHDPSPVPFYLIGPRFEGRQFVNQSVLSRETLGILSDVAPTILSLLSVQKPGEMTGHNLLEKLL